MTVLLLVPILAPLVAAVVTAVLGWRRAAAVVTVGAALSVLVVGVVLVGLVGTGGASGSGARYAVGHLLRADALSVTMLIVIGTVGSLATWASIGYIEAELAHGHTDPPAARLYGVLLPLFLAAMALAVLATSIGVMWVAIEATTVATAFLVAHRRTRAALEATWKYVIICSVGIALALLGTVLLHFASLHAGASTGNTLDIDVLLAHASRLDPAVTRLAAGLLLLGYGAKAGLVPFHTWLADAHSQAPAPVSALMSGVLLSVAMSALLRVKSVVDLALGTGFLRVGLLVVGLLTLG
ncbi:MAG TPA: proton-conducting transporter membrane subunit, partial [Cellulomonadaceae bacterium]|nr:proton-conducting transporter membrane subunit [Cellulomonadaceae bacterium]